MAIGPRGVPPILPEAPYAAGGAHGRPAEGRDDTAAPVSPRVAAAEAAGPTAMALLPHLTAIDEAVARALGRQDGFAPLFATLAALSGTADLPDEIRLAVERLLALRLPATPEGAALHKAIVGSGLFHEAALLGGAGGSDLKGALGRLIVALSGWIGAADAGPDGPRFADRVKPPPPRRGTPLSGQPVEPAPDLPLARLAALALEEADRARARILLHQAESLDDERIGVPQSGAKAPLAVELPVAVPGGTAVLQMRIESEDHRSADEADPAGRIWRVEFALSPDRFGAVTARVGLLPGRRIAIGIWCEEAEAVEGLRAQTPALRAALEAGGLAVSGIDLHRGRPTPVPGERTPVRHRLDVAL